MDSRTATIDNLDATIDDLSDTSGQYNLETLSGSEMISRLHAAIDSLNTIIRQAKMPEDYK